MFQKPHNSQVAVFSPQQRNKQSSHATLPRKLIENYSYGLQDQVGKGFSSQVFKGRNEDTGESAAIKVIEMAGLKTPLHVALLRSEIESLQQLQSPNVIRLHKVLQTQNNTYLITDYCDEGDLGSRLKKEGTLVENTVADLMIGIVKGYQALKAKGIVHRDLKPANILVKDGIPKIADFGFATTPRTRLTMPNVNVGSPLYMSPQALRLNSYSEKSDIWAIGSTAYELLYGQVPWQANSEKELAQKMATQPVTFPSPVSEECKSFIRSCLIVDEQQRASIEDLERHRWLKRRWVQQKAQESAKKALNQPIIQVKQASICKPFRPTVQVQSQTSSQHQHPQPLQEQINKDRTQRMQSAEKTKKKQPEERSSQSFVQPFSSNMQKRALMKIISEKSVEMSSSHSASFVGEKITNQNQPIKEFITERVSDGLNQHEIKMSDFIILAQLNFCRYIFRISQLLEKAQVDFCKEKLLFMISKHLMIKINRLKKMVDGTNIFDLFEFKLYTKQDSYSQLSHAIIQYEKKYSLQFTTYWMTIFNSNKNKEQLQLHIGDLFNNDLRDSITFERKLPGYLREAIYFLLQQMDDQIVDDGFVPLEIEPNLVLLDYLVTYLQLVSMFDWNDWKSFARLSRIEQIAQGKPVRLTVAHFTEIKAKIKDVL